MGLRIGAVLDRSFTDPEGSIIPCVAVNLKKVKSATHCAHVLFNDALNHLQG